MKQRLKQEKTMLWRLVAVVLLASGVRTTADDTGAVQPDVIVTAARADRTVAETAASVSIITAGDIAAGGYNDVPSVLGDQAGVVVRSSTAGPATAEVSMRGFGENSGARVLVLLDGFRINDPYLGGVNLFQIPVSSIERIEIVRGGASAMYGDFAVGGVINIITKQGSTEPAGEVSVEGGSFGTGIGRAEAHGAAGVLIYSVNAEAQSSDGYRENSSYDSLGAGFRLQGDPNENVSLDYGLSAQTLEFDLPGYLTWDEMAADPEQSTTPDDSTENEYVTTSFRLNSKVSESLTQSVGIQFKRSDIQSDVTSWGSYYDSVSDILGITPQLTLDGTVAGLPNRVVAGLDLSFDRLDVDRFDSEARTFETVAAEVDRDVLGVFVRDDLTPAANWLVSGAVRVESAKVEGVVSDPTGTIVDDSATHDASAVDLSLLRSFAGGSKAYLKGGTLYRYPLVDEQISYIGYGTDAFYTDLNPEEGWNLELGGTAMLAEGLGLDLALYQLEMEDEIAWSYMTYRNENLDDTRRVGAEVVLNWTPCTAFNGSIGYSHVDSEFTAGDNDGSDVPLVPEDKVDVTVMTRLSERVSAQARWSHVSEQFLGGDTANLGPEIDAYDVVDLLVRYAPPSDSAFEVFAAIDNVFDEEYAALGYKGFSTDAYYPAAGVGYRGGLSYRF